MVKQTLQDWENFSQKDRSSFHATRNTQKKWDEFIWIYTKGIDRYVPKMVIREKKRKNVLIDVN